MVVFLQHTKKDLGGNPGLCGDRSIALGSDGTSYRSIAFEFMQTIVRSYRIEDHQDTVAEVLEKARLHLGDGGKSKSVRLKLIRAITEGNFKGQFQITKPEAGRMMTFAELCDSYVHESTVQHLDPKAIDKILFGPYGLIRKSGGGHYDYLMDDIEVGFIYDPITGSNVGPIITSGRNRVVALQVMMHAAGMTQQAIDNVPIRVSVVQCGTMGQIQARIISANTGSRKFSQIESKIRTNSDSGVDFRSLAGLEATFANGKGAKTYQTALGVWLQLKAESDLLNGLKPDQFRVAGCSVWSRLSADLRPNGGTFYAWIKEDIGRLDRIRSIMASNLEHGIKVAKNDTSTGLLSSKLAKFLTRAIRTEMNI